MNHSTELFGNDTVYFDIKKRIGKKDILSIPDGYLIDFNFKKEPKLWIIENELSIHDPYSHIGTQLLKFDSSYELSRRKIKKFLLDLILRDKEREKFILNKIKTLNIRNLDSFLDLIIFDKPVRALVVIDECTDALLKVKKSLSIEIQIIEFKTFISDDDHLEPHLHKFTPFAPMLRVYKESKTVSNDTDEIDTIVVAAYPGSVRETFLGENCWYAIRISKFMIPKIKYIAVYESKDVGAITHYAEVSNIEPYKDTDKVIIHFKDPAQKIGPIKYIKKRDGGKTSPPQSFRYTTFEKLNNAKTLDEVF